ncbi:uncharacterized protein LOC132293607 [Cornus florida]|uniref:uncharacterized protein LOC132293607 n=1 Tax=Cornus florida TaxID=4283 RepID=UPI00289C11AD|nr:uncharacterized protein LOC132293607 [Cornus florida]XP_059647130.1 uncharacterized protein LOC132293607 [Cornus florida]
MAGAETSHVDLECGDRRRSYAASDGGSSEDESVCFSDADEGSCYSQFYSTHDGSCDDYSFVCVADREIGGVSESRRASSAAESDCSVDVENGVREVKVHLEKVERDCRICHLTLESTNSESGIAIELGCSCKDDLAAAHKHCAEAWFKIRGNKTCEICNSVARNVFGTTEIDSLQQTREANVTTAHAVSVPIYSAVETRSCLNGHRILNFLLACMVFAFVISWLFHFNIPS